ncbi:PD-(D/E)XK nuclease family protein [Bacillus cereus group sp. BceL300]|uniref:PD-(D/E)XK nuclease family protein n=1 Tax=Bacillus cereus group sp. BceL300 TaxID=3444985 RepID=UPI0025661B5F|nr:PD-(D/E)XK nuclease family protein [Bacillus cereus]HDR8003377.1 PD-(D/E)XK nuclease family protein [Bacillus cereus]
MRDVFFDAKDAAKYSETPPNMTDQTLAEEFTEQVNAFYSLPRKPRVRKEIVFNPSGVTKCARELYYINTNAKYDTLPQVPWRERMSRNGTGSHDVTQADYLRMEEELKAAGIPVKFRFVEAEISGEKSYNVGGYTVKLRGRADGKIAVLDEEGNEIDYIVWEKKTKDKRKNLNKIMKQGQPQDEHKAQGISYALIWGVNKILFEYEALQKPEWKDIDPEKPDLKHYYVEIEKHEARALLIKLSKVVQAIEEGRLPAPELDKCGFCTFKTQCKKDGGYEN